LDDLSAGRIGAFIQLFPVVSWLVKDRPNLAVVQQIPTHEKIGIAFAKTNSKLCAAVNEILEDLKEGERLDALYRKWFGHLRKEGA
jgi:polar amino acid transport system substrate-binding protein